ncbi:MAG: YceI family protein [Micavibrio sp.]
MTKHLLAASLALAATLTAAPLAAQAADTYTFDPHHTSVIWNAGHFGFSNPFGVFSNIEGTLILDEQAPENSKVDVTIPVAMVATGIDRFDAHLRNKDFFDTDNFPVAKFVSTNIERTGDETAKITGDLTLLDTTKPVVLDAKLNKKGQNPMNKKDTVGFSATTTIKRSEFGLNYGLPNVSDDVQIQIEAEANK